MLRRSRARPSLELPLRPSRLVVTHGPLGLLRGMTMDNSFDQGLGLARTAYDARDYRLAFRLYLRLAMQGCVPAQRWVALMLDVGEGCRKDPAVAAAAHDASALKVVKS